MPKLNKKQIRILSITLSVWSIFLIGSGLIMNSQVKPIIQTKYTVSVETKKINQAQAKTNEIKVKNLEIEINNPISVDIKDYLEEVDKLSDDVLKSLKLDTSLVNINEAGTYQYTIKYKKKSYIGTIVVKEKELPNVTITLKEINIMIGESLSSNPRSFIVEDIPDEVYNNLTLDISNVKPNIAGTYEYYVIYKNVKYQQKVIVREPGPTIITPKDSCGEGARLKNDKCVCDDTSKTYNESTKTCIADPNANVTQ